MRIQYDQPVRGKAAGEEETVSAEVGGWYVANGYAHELDGAGGDLVPIDGTKTTSVPADEDPTLAANREDHDGTVPTTADPTVRSDDGAIQDPYGPPKDPDDPLRAVDVAAKAPTATTNPHRPSPQPGK